METGVNQDEMKTIAAWVMIIVPIVVGKTKLTEEVLIAAARQSG
jgi:hypothetical protein